MQLPEVGDLYPFLEELKERTGECVNLGILHDGKAIYVESLEGRGPVRVIVRPGQELSLHGTALGRVLPANLSPGRGRPAAGRQAPGGAHAAHVHQRRPP